MRDVTKLEGEIPLELPGDRMTLARYEIQRDGSMTVKFLDPPVAEALLDIALKDLLTHLSFSFVYRAVQEEG